MSDMGSPLSNSAVSRFSNNVPGIQISELLPQVSRRMDKLSIIRSMHTKGNDHPQGTHMRSPDTTPIRDAFSQHRLDHRQGNRRPQCVPPNVLTPRWERSRQYEEYSAPAFSSRYDPCAFRPEQARFPRRRLELCPSQSPSRPFTAGRRFSGSSTSATALFTTMRSTPTWTGLPAASLEDGFDPRSGRLSS